MIDRIKNYCIEFRVLIRSVPPLALTLFVLSVFMMNLLANKSIDIPLDWLALDAGIIVSWVAFLSMDILTKHFGPKAATQISIFTMALNLLACLIMFIASRIPGLWGAYFDFGELAEVNSALDGTFGGTWYVLLGSALAFVSSAIVNNFSNWGIGKLFKRRPDGFLAYACRSYLSTAIGQFADNLIFALVVSHFFFGWTITQCITCAVTGMVAELALEVVFSPIGYKAIERMKKRGIGSEYFAYIRSYEYNYSAK